MKKTKVIDKQVNKILDNMERDRETFINRIDNIPVYPYYIKRTSIKPIRIKMYG